MTAKHPLAARNMGLEAAAKQQIIIIVAAFGIRIFQLPPPPLFVPASNAIHALFHPDELIRPSPEWDYVRNFFSFSFFRWEEDREMEIGFRKTFFPVDSKLIFGGSAGPSVPLMPSICRAARNKDDMSSTIRAAIPWRFIHFYLFFRLFTCPAASTHKHASWIFEAFAMTMSRR